MTMALPDQVVIKLEPEVAEEAGPQWRTQEECPGVPCDWSENTCTTITSSHTSTWKWKPLSLALKSEISSQEGSGQDVEAEPVDQCETGDTCHLQSSGRRKEKVDIKSEPHWDADIDGPSGDRQKQDKEAEPWSVKKEAQDLSSSVFSTELPLSDNTVTSLLSLTTSHECQYCFATFVLVSSLELHMACLHGEKLHVVLPISPTPDDRDAGDYSSVCRENVGWPECRKTAEGMTNKGDSKGIDKRTDNKRNRQHACNTCFRVFTKADDLKTHQSGQASCKSFVCDVCNKAFSKACLLDKHKLIHTNSCREQSVCNVCNKVFTQAKDLTRHKLVHASQKPFACDLCSKAFTQAGNLKRHKLIHTGHKPYACNVCHKAFFDSSYLKRHKLIHTDHKPFSCDVCNKGFNNTTSLTVHKRIHTGERPYKCPHCDSHFYASSDRHTHIKTVHDGIRPHVCDICEAAFSSTSNLKKHRKTHTGEKPHVCTECGKGFIQLCNLKKHRLIHTGEKPHTCPLCPSAFIWPESLKKHMRKTHQ